jgi:uncharacterized protein YggE
MKPAGSIAVAVALVLLVPGTAVGQVRTVAVNGSATQEVPNDAATVGLSVSKDRRNRRAALRAVAVALRGVIATAQTIPGVGPGDITTGRISVRRVVRGELTIYRAAEGISVVLHQPDRAGELVTAAIAAGATGTRGPTFFASDPEAAYRTTLVAAFDAARAKALALATRAGAVLGPVLTIEESTDVAANAAPKAGPRAPEADEPAPPVKPGASTVTARVRVVFSLQ